MLTERLRTTGALLLCSAMLMCAGLASTAFGGSPCGHKESACADKPAKPCGICDILFGKHPCGICAKKPAAAPAPCASACPSDGRMTADLPPDAKLGECYSKVIVPAQFKTVTERHMIQEASERLEVVPATYKWVEERVMAKEASTQLEVVPAEYAWREKTIEVRPARTGWVMQTAADCAVPDSKNLVGGVFCLRSTPPEFKTIRTQCLVKPACTREITIPAEYQTVRRQVVDTPALARRIPIPAEYETVDRTVLVCPERVRWEHVVCEDKLTSDTVNKVKNSLLASGFKPGPLNGKFAPEDRMALAAFQQKNGLGVGFLSYETLKRLGVSVQ